MKTFSVAEKTIARNIDWEYKWMARDQDGNLCIYDEKPRKRKSCWFSSDGYYYISYFNHLFPAIKWDDDEPTRICDIYNPQVLDNAERMYLSTIIKPFRDRIEFICKINFLEDAFQRITIGIIDDIDIALPTFKSETMYSGMKLGHAYTLEELRL